MYLCSYEKVQEKDLLSTGISPQDKAVNQYESNLIYIQ